MLNIARDRRKTLKKEKEKQKMRKSQITTKNIFLLLHSYVEKFIFLENIFGKTQFISLDLC